MILTASLVAPGSPALAAPRSGATPVVSAGPPAGRGPGSVAEVTLITGDRVRVVTGPGGRQSAQVEAGYARPGVSYAERTIPGPGHAADLLVIPSDAAGLIGSGRLDENLFDVSELVRGGYTDADTASLPLIFSYPRAGAPDFAPTTHGMAVITRALPSIDGAAVSEAKASAAQFWVSLTRPAAGGSGPLALTPQVAKVWLDGRVSAVGDAASPRPAASTRLAAPWRPATAAQPAPARG